MRFARMFGLAIVAPIVASAGLSFAAGGATGSLALSGSAVTKCNIQSSPSLSFPAIHATADSGFGGAKLAKGRSTPRPKLAKGRSTRPKAA